MELNSRSSAASTLPTASTAAASFHPQKNSLVLENGMLKLCPRQPQDSAVMNEGRENDLASEAEIADISRPPMFRNGDMRGNNGKVRTARTEFVREPPVGSHQDNYDPYYCNKPGREAAQPQHPDPYAVYSPQVYPHLMPQNFRQAQKRMPRSTSGGSVLV